MKLKKGTAMLHIQIKLDSVIRCGLLTGAVLVGLASCGYEKGTDLGSRLKQDGAQVFKDIKILKATYARSNVTYKLRSKCEGSRCEITADADELNAKLLANGEENLKIFYTCLHLNDGAFRFLEIENGKKGVIDCESLEKRSCDNVCSSAWVPETAIPVHEGDKSPSLSEPLSIVLVKSIWQLYKGTPYPDKVPAGTIAVVSSPLLGIAAGVEFLLYTGPKFLVEKIGWLTKHQKSRVSNDFSLNGNYKRRWTTMRLNDGEPSKFDAMSYSVLKNRKNKNDQPRTGALGLADEQMGNGNNITCKLEDDDGQKLYIGKAKNIPEEGAIVMVDRCLEEGEPQGDLYLSCQDIKYDQVTDVVSANCMKNGEEDLVFSELKVNGCTQINNVDGQLMCAEKEEEQSENN